ncbi:MAG: hypothetical protein K2Q34_08585 [Alphaproteobacteria bacterium]|nr:hypothetical protein [Alphaproteobacteria bacterium]
MAKRSRLSSILKPAPLSLLVACSFALIDWLSPVSLSGLSLAFIFLCSIIISLIYGLSISHEKPSRSKESKKNPFSTLFKFRTFLTFEEVLNNTLEDILGHLKNLPPSSISLFANLSSKEHRYSISLSYLITVIQNFSFQINASPVYSIPQRKISFYHYDISLPLPESKQFVELERLEVKANPYDKAQIDLAILLATLSKIIKESKSPSCTPFLCRVPESIFKQPQHLQLFKDLIGHFTFPKHLFVFLIQPSSILKHHNLLAELNRQSIQIGLEINDIPNKRVPHSVSLVYISLTHLSNSLKGLARRQASQQIQSFSEQSYKIILSDLEDIQTLQDIAPTHVDYACGPAFGEVQLLEEFLTHYQDD